MALSDFTILTTLMTSVAWTLISYTEAVISCFKNSLFIQKLRDFLTYEPAIPEEEDGILPDPVIREIAFHNVSFSYKTGKPVLKNISFCLHEKETCALVGYNGAGKTTLIKLLLRLYDPTEGEITLNGIDIRRYNLKAYGALNEALSMADVLSVAQKLPYGTDTVLTREFSDEGAVLSGGQYQKIVAARAFSQSDAPIQIFDEPSSALDPSAEYQLNRELLEIAKDKTVIFISHRLSTARDADRIYMLRQGRIIEQGTHAQLLAMDGAYSRMWKLQAMGYQQEEAQR